ncbi:class I SAM-dependent methyltransferase [Deminuibacter soli]|uniref:Class I SAM-dependent methyltransferase n=1 Tax=Deminuibacter soli TaxID=2291815 RepID=A0A3E1NKF8_9BACT|nr:class I SAM-dependent methyltransferase [Deminuibacter soli]RFM28268.1 class I SAM-dependent methyltransferase [Deminuibacter soli]
MNLSQYRSVNKVYHAVNATVAAAFEQQYLAVRDAEHRIYTDAALARLPEVATQHPLHAEWHVRARTARWLAAYSRRTKARLILEIGCGNGWLSNQLAATGATVVGTDINLPELEQAARVFDKNNLLFVHDYFSDRFLPGEQFNMIVFAASVQYFSPLQDILDKALVKLAPGGTIHITDTHFYRSREEQLAASLRSLQYYTQLGFPGMAAQYFHHTLHDLQHYRYTLAHNPGSWFNRLPGKSHPFPWIILQPW